MPAPCRGGLLGRRNPARRGRFGRPEIRSRRGPHLRSPHPEIHRAGHQEHRPRGHGAEGARRDRGGTREARLQGPVRRRLEPRIPEGRCGDQGLHVARPRGRGRRQRTGAQVDGQALPAVPDHQFPRAVHGHSLGRDDQIRSQRHARDAHFVYERDRQPVRPRGRRRGDGPQGHRLRRPHRQQVPLPRLRLRRFMLPEGREGAGPHGPGTRLHDAGHRGRRAGQRAAERDCFREIADRVGRPAGQGRRNLGAGLQARDRRHARSSGNGGDRPPARCRSQSAGLRPRGDARKPPPDGRPADPLRPDDVRGRRRRRRCGPPDRMEGVAHARLDTAARDDAGRRGRRRPQHLRQSGG